MKMYFSRSTPPGFEPPTGEPLYRPSKKRTRAKAKKKKKGRKMRVRRIRVVSGGLPTLGKRR